MKQLDSYIGKGVVWSFFAVAFVLLGLDYALTFIEQVKKINEFYTISNLLEVLVLRLPGKFSEYIPIASRAGHHLRTYRYSSCGHSDMAHWLVCD